MFKVRLLSEVVTLFRRQKQEDTELRRLMRMYTQLAEQRLDDEWKELGT